MATPAGSLFGNDAVMRVLRSPDFTIVATVAAWFVINAVFPPTAGWPMWLLVDWGKRIVLLVPLLLHPEINLWIRSAFSLGNYRHEGGGLFVLRVVSLAVLLLFAHYVVVWIRHDWLQPFHDAQAYYPYVTDPYWRTWDLLFGILLVAVSEEIVARVVLIRWLRRRVRYDWLAVVISSAVFGAFHFNSGVDNMIAAGLMGLVFAAVYLETGSVWPVIAGHYLIDFAVFV